eukprot:9420450-Pyramimonas_sp.AAC.1
MVQRRQTNSFVLARGSRSHRRIWLGSQSRGRVGPGLAAGESDGAADEDVVVLLVRRRRAG